MLQHAFLVNKVSLRDNIEIIFVRKYHNYSLFIVSIFNIH